MKALIFNSGMGTRMGSITKAHPKCLTHLNENDTILSRQIEILKSFSITDFIITTGYFDNSIVEYCKKRYKDLNFVFVKNELFDKTNYIYSMYLASEFIDDDIIMLHGDLVFNKAVLSMLINTKESSAVISSTMPLPDKDFKAEIINEYIKKISVSIFNNCFSFQPLYKMNFSDMLLWLEKVNFYCSNGIVDCYAENAFNDISDICLIKAVDVKNMLCSEIDCAEDLYSVKERLINE